MSGKVLTFPSKKDDELICQLTIDAEGEIELTLNAWRVETAEQLATLKGLGCRLAQGFYYSDAVPEAALLRASAAIRSTRAPAMP